MFPLPRFTGPLGYRLASARVMTSAIVHATARRTWRGPARPGWNWVVELGTAAVRANLQAAFRHKDVAEQRRFLDCMALKSPLLKTVQREVIDAAAFRGDVLRPPHATDRVLLYLHGGGFALYPKASYASMLALMCLTTKATTYALDYRLAPEHPFPAALDDCRVAYDWLLSSGVDPRQIIIAGDSAGGNLTIALLCELRDRGRPLPALGLAMSPATEFDAERPSMRINNPYDWISVDMALMWRDFYCRQEERSDPRISPVHANLRGLPPIYVQAGRSEILYDSICAFAVEAKRQGADIRFDSWDDMNHVFQMFGEDAPQSSQALRKISEMVASVMQEPVIS